MNREVKRVLVIAAGIVFVVLGIVGFALPFLQGVFFLAIGIILLSISSSRVRTWIQARTRRYPKVHAGVLRLERWIRGIIGSVDEDVPGGGQGTGK